MLVSYLSGLSEEFVLTSLLCLGIFLEEGIIDLGNIGSLNVDLCACGQSVSLVHSLQGHSIYLVWAGNQEEAGGQLLEEHNAAATEATGQENKDSAGGNALSKLCSLLCLGSALLDDLLLIISGIPCDLLCHFYRNDKSNP